MARCISSNKGPILPVTKHVKGFNSILVKNQSALSTVSRLLFQSFDLIMARSIHVHTPSGHLMDINTCIRAKWPI